MPKKVPIQRWREGGRVQEIDVVAVESPLEIHVNSESLTLTMRSPGDDIALTLGLLYSEGIIKSAKDIEGIESCPADRYNSPDRVRVTLISSELPRTGWERRFPSTSSCGVCGKTDQESITRIALPIAEMTPLVEAQTIFDLTRKMRCAQQGFASTGGLHAAALFDSAGNLVTLKEDIGRHNAVDKVIGSQLPSNSAAFRSAILMISGRASFEIVQKAAVAQIPIICAISAPSSLAVSLSHDMNITLIGFLRDQTMNVYTCGTRIIEVSIREN